MCGAEPRLDLGGIHLPPHPLFPRRLLLGLELDQLRALSAQPLVEADALDFMSLEVRVQRLEPDLHLREAGRQPLDLRGRLGCLALGVGGGALGVVLRRACFELLLAGALRRFTPPSESPPRPGPPRAPSLPGPGGRRPPPPPPSPSPP